MNRLDDYSYIWGADKEQFCGRHHSEKEARLVSLFLVYEKDNSVGILADMPCGYFAERKDEKSEWIIRKEEKLY